MSSENLEYVFCDRCNPGQYIEGVDGHWRGVVHGGWADAEQEGWVRIGDEDVCDECLEDD
jgi:hypothetical protein